MMMRRIGISIKNISNGARSNSQWSSKEVSHATLTPLGSFGAFWGGAEGIDDPGGNIVIVLGKAEAELKVNVFLTNTGVDVYAVDIADELREVDSTRSIIEFFYLDINILVRRIKKCYLL